MTRRICVVTSGHLSGCPRMLKVADALSGVGYDVRVISTNHMPPLAERDARLHATRKWRWTVVPYGRQVAPGTWLRSGIRRKALLAVAGVERYRSSPAVAARVIGRAHDELASAILDERADLIYAGTIGALAAAASAGRESGVPFALDLEDLHSGEHVNDEEGALLNELAATLVRDAARDAAFVTTASAAMAAAYGEHFAIAATSVHNVFPLPADPPADRRTPNAPLRVYWFSQTLGLRRGLQDVIRALGILGTPAELHLRASSSAHAIASLRMLADESAPRTTLVFHPLVDSDRMVDECRAFDIGASVEQGHIPNSAVTLPNKATTYILAGLPVALTDIPGQRALADDLGEGALRFAPGDPESLAAGLDRIIAAPDAYRRAREASWEAARARWHWEHQRERGALLGLVERVIA